MRLVFGPMQKLTKILLCMLLTTFVSSLSAAPIGYSINSDSGSDNSDSLYQIDFLQGTETRIGTVQSQGSPKFDVEGMAFAPDGTLYAVDDESLTLFPINPDNALVQTSEEVTIQGLEPKLNDFGMTFACDGTLYITSINKDMLYSLNPANGETTPIGSLGGVRIVALAAYGDPVQLYGLGMGSTHPYLYEIDAEAGGASPIGGGLAGIDPYTEGGLAFDDTGLLWAITDYQLSLTSPSQILQIDEGTGEATPVDNTLERGFESLAITVPRGCQVEPTGEFAQFTVQKRFVDLNDETPVTLNIQCTNGQPNQSSVTVLPNDDGIFGQYEVNFVIDNIANGEVSCEIWESEIAGYTASYSCFSEGECAAQENRCTFTDSKVDQGNLCVIRNYPDPVTVTVDTEWFFGSQTEEVDASVSISLMCMNVLDGDGDWINNMMVWSWDFDSNSEPESVSVLPEFDGSTQCMTQRTDGNSAIESFSSCEDWTEVLPGQDLSCTVTNTVFFEGIPTLSRAGLLLFSALMLLTGAVAYRRI